MRKETKQMSQREKQKKERGKKGEKHCNIGAGSVISVLARGEGGGEKFQNDGAGGPKQPSTRSTSGREPWN